MDTKLSNNINLFELSNADKESLKSISEDLYNSVDKALKDFQFPINDESVENSTRLSSKTLSNETNNNLKDFASNTFFLADDKILFSIFKALIDHQLRIIQYYRLFNKFNLLNMLSEDEQKLLNDYKIHLEDQLSKHDSDKLDDKMIIQHYISQEYLSKINNIDKNLKFTFNKIAAALRRIHGDQNEHHNEYYNYHTDKIDNITKYIILEHVIDVISIGDKKLEKIGQFYANKKAVCFSNFQKNNDRLITEIYNAFKTKIFNRTEELKNNLEILKKEKQQLDKIKYLEEQISQNTEKIVWQNMGDGLDDTMSQLKELNKNIYFAIEQEWSKNKEKEKSSTLENFSIISEYKKNAFNKNFNLLDELNKAVQNNANETTKLLKVSAILESLNNLQISAQDTIQSNRAIKNYIKDHEEAIKEKRNYIKRKNETEGKNFYIAFTN